MSLVAIYIMTEELGGYRRDLEPIEELLAGAQVADSALFGGIDPKGLGAPMGMKNVIKLENQYQESSCTGNSCTTVLEGCVYHQSGGQVKVQLSRQFAYVNGQRYSRITGDRGATLKGVADGAKNEGVPLEEYAPYTGNYYTQFKKEAYDNAGAYRLKSYVPIRTVDELYEGLYQRLGGAFFGMAWCGQFKNPEAGGHVDSFRETVNAFHAVAFMDWSEEKDSEGYPRLELFNSHGPNYGDKGISKWSRKAVQLALDSPGTVAFFLSETDFIKPRFDFKKAHWTSV